MSSKNPEQLLHDASAWWDTSIIDIHPGRIAIRGYPIEDLIGRIGFADMIWLMLRGDLPLPGEAQLLEAALVASVDHGPHAPSIAIARMAVTCGVALNGAMASAINVLDDVHGGAGQQCMELYHEIDAAVRDSSVEAAARSVVDARMAGGRTSFPDSGIVSIRSIRARNRCWRLSPGPATRAWFPVATRRSAALSKRPSVKSSDASYR